VGDLLAYSCGGHKEAFVTDETYEPYEPPTIGVIGSLEELTQTTRKYFSNSSDSYTLNGRDISS
jgi:hypothetical protein